MDAQQIDDATSSWITAMGQRRRSGFQKRLGRPPWEEFGYFDTPVGTNIVIGAGAIGVPIVQLNPERVVFIVSGSQSGNAFISVNPGEPAGQGLNISTSNIPMIFYQNDHGALVQSAWFGNATINTSVYVVELFLRRWPDK